MSSSVKLFHRFITRWEKNCSRVLQWQWLYGKSPCQLMPSVHVRHWWLRWIRWGGNLCKVYIREFYCKSSGEILLKIGPQLPKILSNIKGYIFETQCIVTFNIRVDIMVFQYSYVQ